MKKVPILYTLHPTPYTLRPTPYTLSPTPYTIHPTLYTLHPAFYARIPDLENLRLSTRNLVLLTPDPKPGRLKLET